MPSSVAAATASPTGKLGDVYLRAYVVLSCYRNRNVKGRQIADPYGGQRGLRGTILKAARLQAGYKIKLYSITCLGKSQGWGKRFTKNFPGGALWLGGMLNGKAGAHKKRCFHHNFIEKAEN